MKKNIYKESIDGFHSGYKSKIIFNQYEEMAESTDE